MTSVKTANSRQLAEAKRLGWKKLFWNCQNSPNRGKWGGHRARLYGCPPDSYSDIPEIVPDFFDEVVESLNAEFPLD